MSSSKSRRPLSRSWDAPLLGGPGAALRKRELVKGLEFHLGGVAGGLRQNVAAALDLHRVNEVLVEVIHVLEDSVLERGSDGDVVEDGEVLDVLAQSDATCVRADGHAELRSHQEHGDDLVDAAETAGIYLAERDGIGLQELLENDAVLAVLARGDADRCNRLGYASVAKDVVWARRLLDPPRVEYFQALHVLDGLIHVPDLVGVHHQGAVGSYLIPDQGGPPHVVLDVPSNLHLKVRPALLYRLAHERAQLLVRIPEP